MEQNKELQNSDFILPGNLGTIQVGNKTRDIKSVFKRKDGAVTITIGETKPEPLIVNGANTGLYIYSPEVSFTEIKQITDGFETSNTQPKE